MIIPEGNNIINCSVFWNEGFIFKQSLTFYNLVKSKSCVLTPWLHEPEFDFDWITNPPSSKGLTREPPQTDCQKLTLSDFRPKTGARREGLQCEAEWWQRASSLTVDQRWVGGQSVQLVGMRRVPNKVERWNHMPVTRILWTSSHMLHCNNSVSPPAQHITHSPQIFHIQQLNANQFY